MIPAEAMERENSIPPIMTSNANKARFRRKPVGNWGSLLLLTRLNKVASKTAKDIF